MGRGTIYRITRNRVTVVTARREERRQVHADTRRAIIICLVRNTRRRRRIIDTRDRYHQIRRVSTTLTVVQCVGVGLRQRLTVIQRLDRRVQVINRVGISTRRQHRQRTIVARRCTTNRARTL